MLNIDVIYDNYFLGTPTVVQGSVDAMCVLLQASEEAYGSHYQQTNGSGTPLGPNWLINADWYTQAGFQHGSNTYLGLLGAPPVNPNLLAEAKAEEIGPIMLRPKIEKGSVPAGAASSRAVKLIDPADCAG